MPRGRAFHKPIQRTPTEYNGVLYHSKAEAERAAVLDGLQSAGLVFTWFRQVKADIEEPGIENPRPYLLDFLVAWNRPDGNLDLVAEEVKGADSPSFRRHVKQWKLRGRIPLRVIRNGKLTETIQGGRAIPSYTRDGRRFNGVAYRNQAVAQRARDLSFDDCGMTGLWITAFWRDVEGMDFLIAEQRQGGGCHLIAEKVYGKPKDADGDAESVFRSWEARGVVPRIYIPESGAR